MSKVLYCSLVGGALLLGTSSMAVAASGGDMKATVKKLQAQVNALSVKLNKVEAKKQESNAAPSKKNQDKVLHDVTSRAEAYIDEKLAEKEKKTPVGYIDIAGSNTAIKIGGFVKIDTIYDAGPFTGDSSQLPTLPLRNYTADAQRTGYFHMHARQSRLSFASLTATKNMGELATYIECDFFGTNNFGTAAVSRSEPSSASAYNFRLRLAYVDFAGFRFGQDWTTLYDQEATGSTVEFNGISANNIARNAQVRYTMKACEGKVSWAVGLENPYTDYTDSTGTLKGDSAFLGGSGGDGFQQMPDLTTMLKVKGDAGHIAIRGMARQLTVKFSTTSGAVIKKSVGGWAAGISGKLKTYHKGGIYAQGIVGDGVGRYLFDLIGQGAAFNSTTTQFQAQRAWAVSVGIEHYWTEQWRSNLGYGHTGIMLAKFSPFKVTSTVLPISRSFDQMLINTFYKPIDNFEIGFEFNYYLRRATGRYKGTGKRFQLGIKYTF